MSARLWQLHHGDGVDGLLSYGQVDHCIFDPPYGQHVESGNDAIEVRSNRFNFSAMTDELRNRTARAVAHRTRRWAIICCDEEETYLWRFAMTAAGMTYYRKGTWLRRGSSPQFNGRGPAQGTEAILLFHGREIEQRWNGGGKMAVWEYPVVRGTERLHPTQKPTALMKEIVEDFTDPGELIADLFAGVATVGVAAVGLGRRYVGWEIDAEHYKNGLGRLEQPLFERPPEQEMIPGIEPKSARARARINLDRSVLNLVESAGQVGIAVASLVEVIGDEPRTIHRSLDRLRKNGAVLRQGRTNTARWVSQRLLASSQQHEDKSKS